MNCCFINVLHLPIFVMNVIGNVSQGWYLISIVLIWAILGTSSWQAVCLSPPATVAEGSTSRPVLQRIPIQHSHLCCTMGCASCSASQDLYRKRLNRVKLEVWNKNLYFLGGVHSFWCLRGIMAWKEQTFIDCLQTKGFWKGQTDKCEGT